MKYKTIKLKEICTVNQGLQIPISKRFKETGENRYFYITIQFLKGSSEKYYIENPAKSVICNKNDILVVRTGSTGIVLTGVEGCFHNNFFKVVPKDNIYNKYLYYSLNNKEMYKKMLNAASGTTIPDLKHSSFYELEIPFPSYNEQIKIAKILEIIDKKIELNTHTNNNLQELLLSQYKLYFENKEINGKLKDIVSKTNRTIKKDSINKSLKYYPIDILPKNDIILQDGKNIEEAQSSLIEFKNNEILVGAMRVYFHRVCLSNYSGITRNTTFVLKPISDEYIYYSLLTIYQDSFIDYASLTSKGTTMPYAVWENVCSEYNIYIPTKNELQEFNTICKAIIDKMNINQKENSKLEQIRDTLLPKLMNGEIDLDKIEI